MPGSGYLHIHSFLPGKNYFGAEELLREKKVPEKYWDALLKVTDLFGTYEALEQAKAFVHNERSLVKSGRNTNVFPSLSKNLYNSLEGVVPTSFEKTSKNSNAGVGLKDFQLSVGNVEYFKGLCMEAGLDEETELELREFISGKNYFGASPTPYV